jgi:cytochrome oxidase Cu insertion factor (SCO1/SenC/PrrC family)
VPDSKPVPDLGAWLYPLLLMSLALLVLVGAAAALVTWWTRQSDNPRVCRWRRVLLTGDSPGEPEPSAHRYLRLAFGLLWVVDGALQAAPDVPAGFRSSMADGLAASPAWFGDLVTPAVELWARHPVVADATTVWVQVGIGVLLLIASRGPLLQIGLWASIGWSLLVWVAGELVGGLLTDGAGWLSGAPGAVLVYLLAAALLLAPWDWWRTARASRLARRAVAVWLLLAAVLQASPGEGFWTRAGLAGAFDDAAANRQPHPVSAPISALASLAGRHPATLNAVIAVLVVAVAVSLFVSGSTPVVVSGLVVCTATWWLGQDFGVLETAATDPNTAFALGLLLASALPAWRIRGPGSVAVRVGPSGDARAAWRAGVGAAGVAALLAPLTVVGLLLGPPDSAALAADHGGLVVLPERPVPAFRLTDQDGRVLTEDDLLGTLTVVTFLDPVCSDDCPIIANQLAEADRRLGHLAGKVQIVAIDSNPLFTHVADVRAFTTSHGLADLANWHFLAGPAPALQDLLASYGVQVQVPTVGMIEHDEGIYFVGPDARTRSYLSDGADDDLTSGYAAAVTREVRRLLATDDA